MKQTIYLKFLLVIVSVFTINIVATSQPIITSYTPASGAVGTSVTITGIGFDATAANNIVYFGATKATITNASATNLTVTVPSGATYQPIAITNTTTGLVASSSNPFVVTFNGGVGQTITSSSFAARVNFATGMNPASIVAIADIDGDGKPDMIVVDRLTNTFSILQNTSTAGTIATTSFAAKVDFATDSTPSSIAVGDLDGDGKLDIVVTNQFLNKINVYKNTSTAGSITTASFASAVSFIGDTLALPTSVAIGDLDGDGKPDLAVTNSYSNTISIFKNQAIVNTITSTSFAASVDFATGLGPTSVAIDDFDGDGKPDIAVANYNAKTISILRNKTTQHDSIVANSFAAKIDFTVGLGPHSLTIGDLNNDGKLDVIVANQGSNSISVLTNTATAGTIAAASFAAKFNIRTNGESPYYVAVANIDGDNKPDIIVSNFISNKMVVIKNNYNAGTIDSTAFATGVNFATGNYPFSASIADFDGDGKPDIVAPNYGNNNVSVFQNNLLNTLPVVLASYEARFTNKKQVLNSWTTTTEINTSHFNIQRSIDGTTFKTIGTIAAKGFGGYEFTDNELPTTNDKLTIYYRLEIVDKDGSKTYSEVNQLVIRNEKLAINVYPNPAKGFVTIDCKGAKEIMIVDYVGRTIQQINNPTEHLTINTKQWNNGAYFIKAIIKGEAVVARLVVNK